MSTSSLPALSVCVCVCVVHSAGKKMSSRKKKKGGGGGAKRGGKKGKNANLGQKLTSGATTAEDNSTLAGIDAAYGITLDDLRVKAEVILEALRDDLANSPVLSFTEEIEEELRRLYIPATDSGQHEIDATEEMLQFSFQSQMDLQAFVDRVSNFITRTPDVDQSKYYRSLLQLYDAAYRSGLQRLNLTEKRAELIGAKERPHLYAVLEDEMIYLRENNSRLFERFTSQRLVWIMDSGRWDELPQRTVLQNNKVLTRSDFKEAHLGLLTKAVKAGDYKLCLKLIEDQKGFVNETGTSIAVVASIDLGCLFWCHGRSLFICFSLAQAELFCLFHNWRVLARFGDDDDVCNEERWVPQWHIWRMFVLIRGDCVSLPAVHVCGCCACVHACLHRWKIGCSAHPPRNVGRATGHCGAAGGPKG